MPVTQPFIAPDVSDPPFKLGADTVLDLPVPPSVNRTRKLDPAGRRELALWKKEAGLMLMASGQYRRAQKNIARFQITVILCEIKCKLDADNTLKNLIDYLREIEIIKNDAPRNMRRIIVEWGWAPEGVRVVVQPMPHGRGSQ